MLETRNVFIDTQYFVKSNYNFSSQSFVSLRKLCESEELRYVLTSVVEQEVENKIQLSIKESLSSLQSFKKKASVLSTIEDEHLSSLFSDVREEDIYKKASDVFHEYNRSCNYEYIEADKVDAEELLSLYFEKKPPFGDGKKKAEFPDAISLLSLESYLDENEKIYIISDDKDLKSYCEGNERLISIDSLEKLLDLYNVHTNIRTEKIKEYISTNSEKLKERISEYISDCDVYNSSTWEDAEVDDSEVVSVGDIEPSVIEVNDEECKLTFDVNVDLEVTVTGPDFNNGIYDKEDGHMYTFESTTRTELLTFTFMVELNLTYEFVAGMLEDVDWVDLYIPSTSGGIEVAVEENPEPDWY
ncbi:PIN domain-containing protein [Photobacterium sagamiensis]|uniref:PIN domain-containing protein n=1 Tax=Photobacterium sagamiensis TaxID=2910241 RepID=UPI003D1188F8